jgi:glycosyltransferase involved in cell wall biosynthesis
MVAREEEEYALAGSIRVSSIWARETFIREGVPPERVRVVPQIIDTQRFSPPAEARSHDGPLRVCYVGIMNLRKGFPYLLEAMRRVGAGHVTLEIAGSTGSRGARVLFDRLRPGLSVSMHPQDPVPVYRRAELFVLPSLHDGFGFVVAEAMACGLPVVVTTDVGAAELVRPEYGWIVPPADSSAIAAVLSDALSRRAELNEMGRRARAALMGYVAARSSSLPFFDRGSDAAPLPTGSAPAER